MSCDYILKSLTITAIDFEKAIIFFTLRVPICNPDNPSSPHKISIIISPSLWQTIAFQTPTLSVFIFFFALKYDSPICTIWPGPPIGRALFNLYRQTSLQKFAQSVIVFLFFILWAPKFFLISLIVTFFDLF